MEDTPLEDALQRALPPDVKEIKVDFRVPSGNVEFSQVISFVRFPPGDGPLYHRLQDTSRGFPPIGRKCRLL